MLDNPDKTTKPLADFGGHREAQDRPARRLKNSDDDNGCSSRKVESLQSTTMRS